MSASLGCSRSGPSFLGLLTTVLTGWRLIRAAGQAALDAGLGLNAGHDLNRENLTAFVRTVPGVQEVSIGHALMADALELGYAATVADYNRCIDEAFVA